MRYNWCAPIVVSPHDGNVIYHCANMVLKSVNRGDVWTEISPDLTTNDPARMPTGKGGDGNIQFCTITALDESPIVRDLLYAGTDDGNVWVTQDNGKNWTKLNDRIKGNPGFWVSRVVASRHQPGTAYVTYTGLRADDFRPFVYKTTDFGETWTSIAGNLPNKSVNVVREDPRNPDLLYVGAEFGLFVSIDGGRTWNDLHNNMPTQPVYDLQIHPRENDLIVATHGRGLFITDVTALQELNDKVLAADVHLFDVEQKVKWVTRTAPVSASTNFNGPSEPNGIVVNYFLKAPSSGEVKVQVMQGARVVAEMAKAPNAAGINQILWNMMTTPVILDPKAAPPARRGGMGRFGAQAAPSIPTFGGTVPAPPGEYTVVLSRRWQDADEEDPDTRGCLVRPDVLRR